MGKDKILHFVCSALILLISFFFFFSLGLIYPTSLAIITTIIAGVGKEIYDVYKPKPTGFSWADLVADGLGILFGLLLLFIRCLIIGL